MKKEKNEKKQAKKAGRQQSRGAALRGGATKWHPPRSIFFRRGVLPPEKDAPCLEQGEPRPGLLAVR